MMKPRINTRCLLGSGLATMLVLYGYSTLFLHTQCKRDCRLNTCLKAFAPTYVLEYVTAMCQKEQHQQQQRQQQQHQQQQQHGSRRNESKEYQERSRAVMHRDFSLKIEVCYLDNAAFLGCFLFGLPSTHTKPPLLLQENKFK